jgi:predicted kinase
VLCCQTDDVLVMLSGLPGSGKSHFTQALAVPLRAVIVSVDPIEDAMIASGLPMSSQTGVAAYHVGATVAAAQLRNGFTVIVDAANYLEVGRDVWRRVADGAAVPFKAIEVTCSDPDLHRTRLEGRRRGLAAYPEPSWDDVVHRAREAEPWTSPRLVVDSAGDLGQMLEAALRYLDS